MGFFSGIVHAIKNIGKGIAHAVKSVAKSTTKVLRKAWKNPIVKGLVIAGAMYFSAGTIAPMFAAGGSLAGLVGGGLGVTASNALAGGLTMAIVNGTGAAVSGKNVGSAALKGGLLGAAAGGIAGSMQAPATAATGSTGAGAGATAGASTGATTAANGAAGAGSGAANGATQLGTWANGPFVPTGAGAGSGAGSGNAITGLLGKAGNFIGGAIQKNPLEAMKIGLGAVQGALAPDKIDLAREQAKLDQQALVNQQTLNAPGAITPMQISVSQNAANRPLTPMQRQAIINQQNGYFQ